MPKTEATRQQADKGPTQETAAVSENERTSSWTYRKTTDSVNIANQKAESYAAPRKIKDWAFWRVDPLQNEKIIEHRGGAGNAEAQTPSTTERINTTLSGAARDERI
jgi:hypothetical protein